MGKYNAYPKEVVEFIRENVSGRTAEELSILVNEKFGTNFDKTKMQSFKKNHGIRSGREHLFLKKEETVLFPREIKEYIFANFEGTGHLEMAKRLNDKFATNYSKTQIKAFYGRNKLNSGLTGRFEKGRVPFNKGQKGKCACGSEKGWFKKGHIPTDWKPLGTIEIRGDGHFWKKVEEPNIWKELHRIVWEEKNGPIPEGFCVTFLDGNSKNVEISNLALVSRAENLALTRMCLRSEEPEITETGILITKLYLEKQKRKKAGK